MATVNLDMDVLRTLVTAQELGSFSRAARRIGRSQSAVSQQIRKLEAQLDQPLFRKQGRGLVPTDAGAILLSYARRILDLNDEGVGAVQRRALEGAARFGLPADFAESWFPTALGRFKRAFPGVRIEAIVDRNRALLERLDRGELDLVLALGNGARGDAEVVTRLPFVWVGPASGDPVALPDEPVPLAVFEAPCFFRQGAMAALERARRPWRVAFTSTSVHGLWAAVAGGLGLTLRIDVGLPASVRVLSDARLPAPKGPPLDVCLHDGGRALPPALAELRTITLETLRANLATARPSARSRGGSRARASGHQRRRRRQ